MVLTISGVSSARPDIDVVAAFGIGLDRSLHRAAASSAAQLRARAQDLDVEAIAAPIHVYGDPDRLAETIAGLVRYASHNGAERARVALAVRQVGEQACLRLTVAGGTSSAATRLRDEHVGRPISWLALQRAALGQGACLTRQRDRMQGGCVYEMVFRALAVNRMAPPLPRGLGGAQPAAPARRVLVVDDSAESADSVACLLAIHGHDVEVAYDGAGALEKCAAWRPQAVVLDIGLPDISGIEVARVLRRDAGGVALIALSGYGVEDPPDPFDVCLGKPIDPIVLLHIVDALSRADDDETGLRNTGSSL